MRAGSKHLQSTFFGFLSCQWNFGGRRKRHDGRQDRTFAIGGLAKSRQPPESVHFSWILVKLNSTLVSACLGLDFSNFMQDFHRGRRQYKYVLGSTQPCVSVLLWVYFLSPLQLIAVRVETLRITPCVYVVAALNTCATT